MNLPHPDTLPARVATAASGVGADRVAIAFSGGLDSTVLLHAAVAGLGRSRVHAIHVDHAIRAGSEADAHWARERARSLGVRYSEVTLDLPTSNTQANARTARYAAMIRVMGREGLDALMTAHHADDAVETALERMSRGAGLSSMTGLRGEAVIEGARVLRPLLEVSRDQLAEWARCQELTWTEDPSNSSSGYTRNAIRNEAIPVLTRERGITPLQRTIANLRAEAEVVEGAVRNLVDAAALPGPGRRSRRLRRDWIDGAEPTLRFLALSTAMAEIDVSLEQVHIEALDALDPIEGCSWLDVPGGSLAVTSQTITGYQAPLQERRAPTVRIDLSRSAAGALPWFEHVVIWGTDEAGAHLWLAEDAVLEVSGPRAGSRVVYDGGSKRVVDILRESGVSAEDRWSWPCVYVGDECACVVGLRASTERRGARRVTIDVGSRAR